MQDVIEKKGLKSDLHLHLKHKTNDKTQEWIEYQTDCIQAYKKRCDLKGILYSERLVDTTIVSLEILDTKGVCKIYVFTITGQTLLYKDDLTCLELVDAAEALHVCKEMGKSFGIEIKLA